MTAADRTKRHTHTNTNDADTTKRAEAAMIRRALGRLMMPGYEAMAALDALVAELDRLRGERDAYKRAKVENDERFMIERDEARAELERVTREQEANLRGKESLILKQSRLHGEIETLKAELVAAAGREQRLRDAAQTVVNALDAYASVGGADLETLRAVLEEGQQPRPTMAEALDAAGMLRDPEMEEGQP